MSASPVILTLVPDLLTMVRVESAVQRMGAQLRAADSDADFLRHLSSAPALAVLDLGMQWLDVMGVIDACRRAGVPVLAFGPHADLGRQRDAMRAGADFVYPRSKFMADTTGCLRDAVSGARAQTA
jgi:DNA-binding NtrC family response regulator